MREVGRERNAAQPHADHRQGIQSVEVGMTLLVALEESRRPMTLTEIASTAGMQPNKAHRYLVSLGRIGLVTQSPASGLYDLGPAMRRIGAEALRRIDEVGLVSAQLPGLRDRTRHAVNLAAWGERGPLVLRWDYGSYPLPITVRVGATLPLLTSSVGLACLAWLPNAVTGPVLEVELEAAPDRDQVRTATAVAISRTRSRGYAITSGEVIPGVTSLAAPVLDRTGWLSLVVAVALPTGETGGRVIRVVAEDLLGTTRRLSSVLGWSQQTRPTSGAYNSLGLPRER